MIDNAWWCGKIVEKTTSRSPFLCYQVLWDNDENENLSPWDMEPINPKSKWHWFMVESQWLIWFFLFLLRRASEWWISASDFQRNERHSVQTRVWEQRMAKWFSRHDLWSHTERTTWSHDDVSGRTFFGSCWHTRVSVVRVHCRIFYWSVHH